jgi:molybdate transport system ATP-binding protein
MELLQAAHGVDGDYNLMSLDWNDPSLPSMEAVFSWWTKDHSKQGTMLSSGPLVQATNLSIHRGDATLLHNLDWTIEKGQRWLVGGGNGAGKSTLSRLLANPDDNINEDSLRLESYNVGWVSTESHMQTAKSHRLTGEVLAGTESSNSWEVAKTVAGWLGVGEEDILAKPFSQLSQGQQKLVLISAALASRPPLLVLDEPCQGLDLVHRQRLLTVVERICQATDISLVYITHHFEELMPSITHALHLNERRDVYNGPIEEYNPEEL